jgi:hypothetical protein
MVRLTKSEIASHKLYLADWNEPIAMQGYVEEINDHMGSKDFLTQAGIEFLRDAWIAATFATTRGAKLVHLVSDEWPDFEIQLNDKIERYECTEADELGRRRGDEYREAEARADSDGLLFDDDPIEDWIKRANQVPEVLRAAIEKKVLKRYGSVAQLVILLNINEFGIRQSDIVTCFPHICEAARDNFSAVWILWKNKTYGPFALRRDILSSPSDG